MTAEAVAPPLAVSDAAQALNDALNRVRMHQRDYGNVRRGTNALATTRSRTHWGLAVLEWIEASVALAEAEDRRDPVRAASDSRGRRISGGTGAGRVQIEASWRWYQQARKNDSQDLITGARAQWRTALVNWFQALALRRGAEDQQHFEELRNRQLDSKKLDPKDAFSSLPASRAEYLVQESEERRRAGIRRDQSRYQLRATGWTPAKRASGS